MELVHGKKPNSLKGSGENTGNTHSRVENQKKLINRIIHLKSTGDEAITNFSIKQAWVKFKPNSSRVVTGLYTRVRIFYKQQRPKISIA